MPILGAHMSIAGGYYRAAELARAAGCDCVQLFTKNNNQWRAKPISDDDIRMFRAALRRQKISHPLSHASYLINLASSDRKLRNQSIDAMAVELERAEQLGIGCVVVHPGSFTTSSESRGLKTIAASIDRVLARSRAERCRILLENTAGQGTNLGWRFEHLAEIIDLCKTPKRMGVCLDTCHAFAAGYALAPEAEFQQTLAEFHRVVGLRRLRAIHLNDSKQALGSRRDRHEHIGRGKMGREPFRLLLADRRLACIPMYLETPKGQEQGRDLDEVNLETLRGLVGG